jgi:hypothetical protein
MEATGTNMSEQRLDQVIFKRKRPNAWSVDLNTSKVYRASGDRLLGQPAFITSRQADSLEIRGGSIVQGGNLLLGRGDDTITLQLDAFSGEGAWTIDTGEDDDWVALEQPQSGGPALLEAFSIKLGAGDDRITHSGQLTLHGSSSLFSLIDAGLGNDHLDLGQTKLEAINLDAGPGKDVMILYQIDNSNLSSGDDADNITLVTNGAMSESSLSCGAGEDKIEIFGVIEDSSIDTGSDRDEITAAADLRRTEINTGEGDDSVVTTNLTDCSIQTGDGNDLVIGHLAGMNDIMLNDGNDLFQLNSFSEGSSTINAGTGFDKLSSSVELLITEANSALKPSYTETVTDSGNFVFTYYGDTENPLLILIDFESISFANASFGSIQ